MFAHLAPLLLLPVFPAFWLLICWLIARSAWAPLARFYAADDVRELVPPPEQSYSFESVGLQREGHLPTSYRGALTLGVSAAGLRLSVLFLFRFQHPPLLIPWKAISPPGTRTQLWGLVKQQSFYIQLPDGERVEVLLNNARLAETIAAYQAQAA